TAGAAKTTPPNSRGRRPPPATAGGTNPRPPWSAPPRPPRAAPPTRPRGTPPTPPPPPPPGRKAPSTAPPSPMTLAFVGCSPAELSWKAGVDVLSLGATKNGAMGAEVVIFFDSTTAKEFEFRRKRGGHLFSKMRLLSSQLDAYFSDSLWLDNA